MNIAPAEAQPIAVFGGSGATGKALIRHALIRGIKVRALVRNASAMQIKSGLVEAIEGPLSSADHVELCLKGCDAAICVFGPRPPYTDIFCEAATRLIVESMQKLGIKRLVCQTGGMIGGLSCQQDAIFQGDGGNVQPALAAGRQRPRRTGECRQAQRA